MDENSPAPRVVVGVDGSSSSFDALRWGVRHAALIGGVVEAVTVWDMPYGVFAPAVDVDFDLGNARDRQTREIREVLGEEEAASVRTELVRGDAADILLKAAEGAQVLVVGSRGHGGFARTLLGSVSHRVAQHAPCPVVIIRPPKES